MFKETTNETEFSHNFATIFWKAKEALIIMPLNNYHDKSYLNEVETKRHSTL